MVSLKAGSRPPWVGLGAAVWLQIASGNAYNFPLYSHSLKSVLGFSQHQLTMLGVANDIGENVGLLPGIASNKLPPWLVLFIGSLACFFGYAVIWLAVTRTVESLPYWLLWIALCVATNSSAWLSTAVLVTNMRNFPFSRGTVAGILKGYGGLSAAVFTEIYSLVLQLLVKTPKSMDTFFSSQIASVVLGFFILTTIVLDHMFHLSASMSYACLATMIILLMAPLAIPVKMTFFRKRTRKSEILDQPFGSLDCSNQGGNADKTEPLLEPSSSTTDLRSFHESNDMSEVAMLLAEGEGAVKKKRRPKRGEDFKFREAVIKADFWLLFLVYFVGVGSGVTVLNNLAQIGIAQGVHDTTILLSLFSFCNFVGRLGGGIISEHFVRSKAIPRTVWMTCTQVIMIITYLLFASAIDGTLFAATALLGICYGVQFSIMIPTVSELFGLKHFGYIYDNEAAKQHGTNLLNLPMYLAWVPIASGSPSWFWLVSVVQDPSWASS
ncbi:hypothetical protein Patl1_14867 [Pistacia atlantica]|uniref:Uncharacterized protein n=1 Tax=Pistacia atlantica TaxID=434234 RepID=A0ACC1AWZ7_9ROSI|nr:hypothetical protein Patl1_14867 [Pistacia atlantica]